MTLSRIGLLCAVAVVAPFIAAGVSFAGTSLPTNITQDLDRNINGKGSGGYLAKGWLYKTERREFIIYVLDGKKWLDEYVRNPDLPTHSVAIALAAQLIIEDAPTVPTPRQYVFKDGERELFKLEAEKIVEKLKDLHMR